MEQPAHPHPQEDFPFLLLRTILTMTPATAAAKTALTRIVAIFSTIHADIFFTSCLCFVPAASQYCNPYFAILTLAVNLVASL